MKIKLDCHVLTGTAEEVVKELGKFFKPQFKTVDEYMKVALTRMGMATNISGRTTEERCLNFLERLAKENLLQILNKS
jgi:hypothetical protein